jgi:hypothetical protein
MTKQIVFAFAVLIILPDIVFGQKKIVMDLASEYKKGKLNSIHRSLTTVNQDGVVFIRVSEDKKEGIVWLPLKKLRNGTIEIELRGKDVLQQSFIGIVFHGLNDSTYDAVYCRPFNFLAKDSVRRIHAIQYISHPVFTWKKLRDERNAEFEKEIVNPPDPNGWFTMKIVIDKTAIKAYINKSEQPSLVVEKLNNREIGKIGLFTGDGSGGDFKAITVNF